MNNNPLSLKLIISEFTDFQDIDPEMIDRANKTSRSSGAVGKKAIVPRAVLKVASKNDLILDFGAGKDAMHAQMLRDEGYNVVAYEFGSNLSDVHDPKALSRQYSLVYASNVLNVQGSEKMLRATLRQINKVLKPGGKFVFNFPSSPRYGAYEGMSTKEQGQFLLKHVISEFKSENIKNLKKDIGVSAPVYLLIK